MQLWGMGLRQFNEDVAMNAQLSSAAFACAALADSTGNGNAFLGTADLDARAAVEILRRSWPSLKGLADSPDNPGEWARRSQAKNTLRMAGLHHAVTHAVAGARAPACSRHARRTRPGRHHSSEQRPCQTWLSWEGALGLLRWPG